MRYTGKADDRSRADKAYAEAMERLVKAFPDDLDARTLYAEALMAFAHGTTGRAMAFPTRRGRRSRPSSTLLPGTTTTPAAAIPGASFTLLEDIGHAVHWEQPEALAKLLR